MPRNYSKQPQTTAALIDLLKSRNLLIADEDRATRYLETIGYYRLTGYMYHMQEPDQSHHFVDGTSFDDIVNAYKFDKRLRALLMEYVERVEVVIRAKLTNYCSLQHGFFWYTDASLFDKQQRGLWDSVFKEIMANFDEPKELFLKVYKKNYPNESFPPSQMALEILSLGKLVRLYKSLAPNKVKEQIAADFNLPAVILEAWLVWLTNARNVCAHHGRLWNRIMAADRPAFPKRRTLQFAVPMAENANTTMYGVVALMHRLLKAFNPDNSFATKVEALIREYEVDATKMGFPSNWTKTAVWHFE